MFTIGQVAKRYSLSRSTLIYYDSIGILPPRSRNESNYRLYSNSDLKKLEKISLFRHAGLSLNTISLILDKQGDELNSTLEQRLFSINREIQALRDQQKVILQILNNKDSVKGSRVMTKDTWVALLRSAGLDEVGMKKWHIEFEVTSPEAHQDFLESLGIEKKEIALIREWSRFMEK